ncbi:hypothetical protein HYW35_03120, partial [Candidatus Saccharibacteria bacterium]|nr:hypothetical protein [Candidatus Saccharibacteria bacterium]
GGDATGGTQVGGGVTIDSGSGTTGGAIAIGGSNAASVAIGRSATSLTINTTGNVTHTSAAAGSTGYQLGLAGLTSGTGMLIFSSSNSASSGKLLSLSKTGTGGSTAFTGDIANIAYSQTFSGGVGLESTGNALDVSRSITMSNAGNTHTISGALVTFSDSGTQSAGTLTHTANVLSLTQSYASASGAVLAISNSGAGVDILGTSSTWQVTKAGVATFVTATAIGSQTFTTNNIVDSGALTIKTTTSSALTLDSGTTGDVNLGNGSNAKTITIGNSTGATALNLTSGTGSQTFASSVATTATTSSAFVFTDNALTTGTGLYLNSSSLTTGTLGSIASTSTTQSSGKLFNIDHTATYTTTVANSGNLLNLNRGLTTNTGGALTTTGAVAALTSNCTVTAGSCTDSANILSLTQTYASASGAVLAISNSGTGVDILGTSSTWQVTKAGVSTFATVNAANAILTNTVVATVPLVVKAAASQTGNLTNWLDSSSNVLVSVEKQGGFIVGDPATITSGAKGRIGAQELLIKGNSPSGKDINIAGTHTAASSDYSIIVAQPTSTGTGTNISGFTLTSTLGANSSYTNFYGVKINNPAKTGSPAGLLTNNYGVYVTSLTSGSALNYAVYTEASTPSYFGGNVGIGDTASTSTLKVVGSLCVSSATGNCAGTVSGTIYATNTTVQAADMAENYISSQPLEPGTLVTPANDGNSLAVLPTSSAYQASVVGVISTNPGVTLNSDAKTDSLHPHLLPMALAGRIPVKVTDENGAIHPGDYLTSSSTPGYAMKATTAGPTIGKALESFSGSKGDISVLINMSYYGGTGSTTADWQGGDPVVTNLVVNGELKANQLSVSSNASFKGTITVAGNAVFQGSVTLGGHVITTGEQPIITASAGAGAGATASVDGNDQSGTVTLNSGAGSQIGSLVRLAFHLPYAKAPRIILTPANDKAAALQYYYNSDTQAFEIKSNTAPLDSTPYVYSYWISQ